MPQRIEVPGQGIVEFPDGMSDEQITAAIKANTPSTFGDVAKSAGIGLAKGAIGVAGMLGDASHIIGDLRDRYIANPASRLLGLKEVDLSRRDPASVIGSEAIQRAIESQTGEFYKPKTTAGRYAQTAAEFVPGALLTGGGGAIGNAVRFGVVPGLASEAAGQQFEGTKAEPYARMITALLAGGAAGGAADRLISPLPVSPARQRLLDVLREEGVTSLTAGQRTGSPALRYAESILGDGPGAGGRTSAIQRQGQEQFTEAAMRRAGAGPDAAPEVLRANNDRLAQQFRDLSARNTLTPDNQFITDLTAAVRPYRNVVESQQRAMVQGYIDDILPYVNNGAMPGNVYQPLRSRLSQQANNNRVSDADLSGALRGMRNALDDAMARSISPADSQAWTTARRQYAAQKVIEKAASRAGEATAEGQIVPANLRNAVAAENRGAYARGQGDFSELARAGSGVMAQMPNSGTAQRNLLSDMAKVMVTAPAGRALMSRPAQAYLGNQLVGANNESVRRQIARLLMTGRSSQLPLLETGN